MAGNQAQVVMNAESVTVYVFYPTIRASNVLFDSFRNFMHRKSNKAGAHRHPPKAARQSVAFAPRSATAKEFMDSL